MNTIRTGTKGMDRSISPENCARLLANPTRMWKWLMGVMLCGTCDQGLCNWLCETLQALHSFYDLGTRAAYQDAESLGKFTLHLRGVFCYRAEYSLVSSTWFPRPSAKSRTPGTRFKMHPIPEEQSVSILSHMNIKFLSSFYCSPLHVYDHLSFKELVVSISNKSIVHHASSCSRLSTLLSFII